MNCCIVPVCWFHKSGVRYTSNKSWYWSFTDTEPKPLETFVSEGRPTSPTPGALAETLGEASGGQLELTSVQKSGSDPDVPNIDLGASLGSHELELGDIAGVAGGSNGACATEATDNRANLRLEREAESDDVEQGTVSSKFDVGQLNQVGDTWIIFLCPCYNIWRALCDTIVFPIHILGALFAKDITRYWLKKNRTHLLGVHRLQYIYTT